MSTTYIGIYVMVLSEVLPKLGITIGSEELTTFLSVLSTIGGALLSLYGRYRLGGVSTLGRRV